MLGKEGGHLLGGHHQHLARHCAAQLAVAGHRAQQDFFSVKCLVQRELTQQPLAQLLGLQLWAAQQGMCPLRMGMATGQMVDCASMAD